MFNIPIGLRAKVVILSLFLLCLPWLGYEYVWEMEKYLRHGQEKTLEGTTQALATALHERPKLFNHQASFLSQVEKGRDLYAYPLSGPIQLDGKLHDWQQYQHRMINYSKEHVIFNRNENQPVDIHFTHMVGKYAGYLYGFFQVNDKHVVFRNKNSLRVDKNDHLVIATQAPDGQFRRYIIANTEDGWLSAFELPQDPTLSMPVTPEIRIQGQWLSTAEGYNIEFRLPLSMVGSKLGFAIYNVDDIRTRTVNTIIGTSAIDSVAHLGTVLVPSPEIENIIKGMSHNSSRIWVVDNHGRVLAKSGDIRANNNVWSSSLAETQTSSAWSQFKKDYLLPLYYKILTKPPQDFVDSLQDSTELSGSHIQQALNGKRGSTWRLTPDNKAVVLAAASPIWIDDKVMGAVIAEETTHGIRTLRNRALEKLFNVILTIMSMGTLALFIFASSISSRIRKLRDQSEQAIDSQGRVRQQIVPSKTRDEIGDLSRSFANIVGRLGQYTHYLENMSSRLSHELRTPVAVVRSSLEHLSLQPLEPASEKYVNRAQEGVSRLHLILNNLSEATRLEASLSHAERSEFPLQQVVSGCMQGYQYTYPDNEFAIDIATNQMMMNGVPEYIAQLMDKLINNAIEFSTQDPIQVSLTLSGKIATLKVTNRGPLLPVNMSEQIFESMVSIRPQGVQSKPHLGLGLYIGRLITEFHKGTIKADNLADGTGVTFTLTFPVTEVK
ncbi:proteobacterial dedicated sortase system histidine kinase [Shewanella sp. MMG014]|uniref:proteobacterial dedicated sortase system histidine kinase n=1 Tax=Shewanella sp. MMG014 TaxID=2822691 RepID=UPI001B38DB26|nr:proteobacterial dedicated sortase system histidine kinase [Shewanella sp. MMG014]MBQ4890928.1 proteobacterial dedicated sortase system histidine kinase [Shewanella sp. MMG014]